MQAPSLRDRDKVDPDLVMAPHQIRALGKTCATSIRATSSSCGFQDVWVRPARPSSCGAATSATATGGPAFVTARGTHTVVSERFLRAGEGPPDRSRGEVSEPSGRSRYQPSSCRSSNAIWSSCLRAPTRARSPRRRGRRLNMSNFQRSVWAPARRRIRGVGPAAQGPPP